MPKKPTLAPNDWTPPAPLVGRPYWFEDDPALVEAAIAAAKTDVKARRRLVKLVAAWATSDERFRRELQGDLALLGQGKRGQAPNPMAYEALLVDWVNAWRQQGLTLSDACEKVLAVSNRTYGNADAESLASRYQKAKKRLSKLGMKPLIDI